MRAQVGKYRLKIVEYYDSLLNQIDLCVETYLRDGRDEPGVSLTANTIRDQMFMEIKQVEYENLTNLQSCSIDHVTRLAGHELDRLLFNKHCFLIQRSDFKYPKINVPLFGYLVKTDFYLSDEQLGYFKDTLRNYSCFMGLLSPQNFYFNLNNSIEVFYSHTFNSNNYSSLNIGKSSNANQMESIRKHQKHYQLANDRTVSNRQASN